MTWTTFIMRKALYEAILIKSVLCENTWKLDKKDALDELKSEREVRDRHVIGFN